MLPTHRSYALLQQNPNWKARRIRYTRNVARCLSSQKLSFVLLVVTIAFVGLLVTSDKLDLSTGFSLPFVGKDPEFKVVEAPTYDERWPVDRRAEAVREAFLHAYRSYEKYAMPMDELRPITNGSMQILNGWGLTVYDSLDTLWLMDLKGEFNRATKHISKIKFRQSGGVQAMFFETVIRYLGGLLSAYALSHRQIFLDKADELGRVLLPAFNTTSGMPAYAVDLQSGTNDPGPRFGHAVLAEIASCQMEFKYLAHLTGRAEFFNVVNKTMDLMEHGQRENGMWATTWDTKSGTQVDDHITVGALADSAYEYLLKQYLMSSRSEKRLRDMYLKTAQGIIHNLLYISPRRELLYATDIYSSSTSLSSPSRRFEHLTCFLPGMFALGAHTLSTPPPNTNIPSDLVGEDLQLHRWAAEGLVRSCWAMYADMPTGLGAEIVQFDKKRYGEESEEKRDKEKETGLWTDALAVWNASRYQVSSLSSTSIYGFSHSVPPGVYGDVEPLPNSTDSEREYHVLDSRYLLRPETIESIYIQYRTTRDKVWRERAWTIFLALERRCRQKVGYSSVRGVNTPMGTRRTKAGGTFDYLDEMPSYALAETFKYLYLIFLEYDPLPMDKWVFNTEAHPFPIFEWTEKEKRMYGIPLDQ